MSQAKTTTKGERGSAGEYQEAVMKKGWQIKRLGEVCEIVKGRKPMLKLTPDCVSLISKVKASDEAKLMALPSDAKVKVNAPLPVAAEAAVLVLVARVVTPFFKMALMVGEAGMEPLLTV